MGRCMREDEKVYEVGWEGVWGQGKVYEVEWEGVSGRMGRCIR